MGKGPQLPHRKTFVGPWIDAIPGTSRKGAVEAARLASESYITNVDTGKLKNPSSTIMMAFSEYLGVTVNDLYHAPPSKDAFKEFGHLSTKARETLIRGRRK